MDKKDKESLAREALPGMIKAFGSCELCGRRCGVNRIKGEKGACGAGKDLVAYSSMAHLGEEPPLSGNKGSGTVFFSGCGMKCVYCQNFRFSQSLEGKRMSPKKLAETMLRLQDEGCHNINLVNPTHFVPGIVEALGHASSGGLEVPIVYNTGGYDSIRSIRALEGLVDIYLPDMRYSSDEMAARYSFAPGYVDQNRSAVKEMFRQVGHLKTVGGIATRGLVVRLLILPGGVSGTEDTLEFVASEIGKDTCISLMSQYYPAYRAFSHEELIRRITRDEYDRAVAKMHSAGLHNGWTQPFSGDFDERFAGENFLPDV